MDDLLQEFIAETRETLDALSGEIVAWEANPEDRAHLDAIFRFVHTVKGSCGFLDLPRLARLSHAAEDVLAAVRAGERLPDTRLVNAVLAIVDRIGEIVEAIDAGAGLDDSGEDLLIAALEEDHKYQEAALPSVASAAQRAPSRSVRLSVDLLDRMMSGMSDMVLARNELARRLRDENPDPTVEAALERLSLTVAEMRDTVTRTRMQKIDALFSALPRMVRDTATELGKSVGLTVEGADVELDREMIEMIRDPLVHIVRNAIDHGLEVPEGRRAAGKRESGRLFVGARQSGNQIVIEISDDGRGIDVDRVIRKLAANGKRSEHELRSLSERAKLDLIFEAGLTTKDEVTEISGRGVGMDVVRANVEQIGGRIDLTNMPGKGLRVAIHVPLTLSIIPTIVVGVAGQRFAIPRQAIEEIVKTDASAIRIDMLGDTPMATVRGRRMPLVHLAGTMRLTSGDVGEGMLAIIGVAGGSYALAVDAVLDDEELVIKPAAPAVMATGIYAGQTLPDSGMPMLLLDCAGIASDAGLVFAREGAANDDTPEAIEEEGIQALLFDDLDGARRLMPLAVIERIEAAPVEAIRHSAGRLRLSVEDRIIPLITLGEWQDRADVSVLRLRDGISDIAYAIGEALDIVTLPLALSIAEKPGPVAGVVAMDGEQVELIDVHWLFGQHGEEELGEEPALCLLDGSESAWMATFLRPVLESAGYHVIARLKEGQRPTVVLTMDTETSADLGSAPVVRLRRTRADERDGTIYRYDRVGLIAALAAAGGAK